MDERAVERADIREHFLLHHDGALVLMHELDGVLDSHDLAAALAVDEVHEVIQRGRLARAGRAGDEHEAVGFAGQFINALGQTERLARRDFVSAETEAHLHMPVAPVERGAHAARSFMQQRNAQLPFLLELFELLLVQQSMRDGRGLGLGERVLVGQDDLAVHAIGGRHAGDEVQVRRVELRRRRQETIQVFSAHTHW